MAEPERTCRVCRLRRPKSQLVRWVVGTDGLVKDPDYRMSGRGYYSCHGDHEALIAKTLKKGRK